MSEINVLKGREALNESWRRKKNVDFSELSVKVRREEKALHFVYLFL